MEINEMGGARSTYGKEECFIHGFCGETGAKEATWKTQASIEYNMINIEI
jgi:hypothetical protein